MRVLLPGVAGFVGKAVLKHLLDRGHEVYGLIRSEKDRMAIPQRSGLSLFVGDVTMPRALHDALPQLDACIYLPGLLREFPARGITFQSVHADAVRDLIQVTQDKGCHRWVQMSALGVGESHHTGYYDTKLAGEAYVKSSNMNWTIFRPSVIFSEEYDPRMNFVSELGNVISKAPVIPIFGDGLYRLQPIALDVLAPAMVGSLTMPETYRMTYEVGGPEKLTYQSIINTIAAAQGMGRKPIVHIPFAPIKAAAVLLDRFAFFPVTRDQLAMLQFENIVRHDSAEESFERTFHPRRVEFADGVKSFFAGKLG